MHVCTECGHVSDEDLEFCPRCGSVKGANIDEEQMPPGFKVVSSPTGTIITRVDVRRIRLALMLALLPGIVDIFGLGHIAMGKYIRGIAFLGCSAFYYYERYVGYFGIEYWYLFGFTMAVFLVQMLDMFRIVKSEIGLPKWR